MKLKPVLIAAVLALLLSGCYGGREIDSFANVTAVAIEPGENKTLFTFAVADAGSFDSDGDKGSQSGIMCCSAEADNLENAINEVNKTTSKLLSFSHMSVVFISEKSSDAASVARQLDSMADVRPQTLVAVCRISPSEYLKKVSPELEVNMEKYFMSIFGKNESYIPVLNLGEFSDDILCGKTALAPAISGKIDGKSVSEEDVSVVGAAALQDGRVVKITENTSPIGLVNSTKNVNLAYKGKEYLLKSAKKAKIHVKINSEQPYVNIDLCVKFMGKSHKDADYIASEVQNTVKSMLSEGYDVFGISSIASVNFLDKTHFESYDIDNKLKNCHVNVNVKIV